MITVSQVKATYPEWLSEQSLELGKRAAKVAAQMAEQSSINGELAGLWTGPAGDAAHVSGEQLVARQHRLRDALLQMEQALGTTGAELSATRTELDDVIQTVEDQGWQVADDGTVSAIPGGPLDEFATISPTNEMRIRQLAAEHTVRVKTILAQFDDQDADGAARLKAAAAATK